MAARRTTTARRTPATVVDFRAIVGDDNNLRAVEVNNDFPGCCGVDVLRDFPYDRDFEEESSPTKQKAQDYINGGSKVTLATVDVQSQSKALTALLALGFTEITRFPGERAGLHIALLMKKNTRR